VEVGSDRFSVIYKELSYPVLTLQFLLSQMLYNLHSFETHMSEFSLNNKTFMTKEESHDEETPTL